MERQLEIISYLLAWQIGMQIGETPESVLSGVKLNLGQKPDEPKEKPKRAKQTASMDSEAVERIYGLYPTKCPVGGRATGKSSKDKEKIARILQTMPEEKLTKIIKRYIDESIAGKSYIKNFATLLNNLPDYPDEQDTPSPSFLFEPSLDPDAVEWARKRYE